MGKLWIIALVLVAGSAQAEPGYKLRVMFWTCSQAASGAWVAQGQVNNQSGKTLRNIRVNMRALDGKGQVKGTNSRLLVTPTLVHGQSSRFRVVTRTKQPAKTCQIWFRNDEVIQIPTRVPALHSR